jgi:hypothetical protein
MVSCYKFLFLYAFVVPTDCFVIPPKYSRRCPLIKHKVATLRTCRTAKCTMWKLSKKSNDIQQKGLELMLKEPIHYLKFFLNEEEMFVLSEFISLFFNRRDFEKMRYDTINCMVMIIQIFLKRFFLPFILKHGFLILQDFFRFMSQ